ncbi:MAG: permease-like cell division protein FtsX [Gammaproteobacteria bacterium]
MNVRKTTSPAHSRSLDEIKRRFSMWTLQHAQAFVFSLGQLIRNPISNLLTASVIGISLALPSGFYIVLENAQEITSGWDSSLQITLFLKYEVDDAAANTLAQRLEQDQSIEKATFISREEALAEYRHLSGFEEALQALDENPLPSVLLIRPGGTAMNSPVENEQLLARLRQLPEIDSAQFDQQWVKRLFALLDIIKRVVIILSTLLAIAVLLIIGNTIRLAIYNRRQEIEITKLFGATDAFIRRPFLYSGLWYGVCGSFIAWLLTTFSLQLLRQPVSVLAELYASDFHLIGLTIQDTFILLLSGVLLGLIGSWVAVHKHLRDIEPA